MRSLDELRQLPWRSLLESLLDSQQRKLLQQHAPENFTLPSGRNITLQYEVGKPPILAARIQEFFGLSETPRIAAGRVPLLLHLLAPNMGRQQITDDFVRLLVDAAWSAKNYEAAIRNMLGQRIQRSNASNPEKASS